MRAVRTRRPACSRTCPNDRNDASPQDEASVKPLESVSLRSKLPSVGTTIFTVMSKLAADVGAINLSQGFPDFDCDPALVEAVARHMREGRNQSAPRRGGP